MPRELVYFDAHAAIGVRPNKDPEERWSLQHVLEDMELCGIAGALVRHTQALVYDFMHGNLRLVDEIAEHRDRLFPLWTVTSHHAGDFPQPDRLWSLMQEHDVRAMAIFPRTTGCPVDGRLLTPLAELCTAEHLPLWVSMTELGDFTVADRLLEIFAGSPVVLTDHTWAQWRAVTALMDLHDNLHVEFSSFQANRAIEYFSQRYGVHRCLFGTGQPAKSPGAARAFLDYGLQSFDERRQVAAGNLRRLLRGAGPTQVPAPGPWSDQLTAEMRAGKPQSCLVVDAHCHVLHEGAHGAGAQYVMIQGDATHMLELTRRMGVDATALMSWNGAPGMDAEAGNQVTAAAVAVSPDEFFGLAHVNPTHQSPDEIETTIQRYHIELGFPGLKPYQRMPIPYNHPSFDRWWQFADEHHLYALFHISVGGVAVVLDLAQRYPGMSCLVAHTGGSYAFARQVVGVMQQAPNIYAELTLTPVTNGIIEWLVDQVGPERVLFGTDAPMRDPRPQMGWCVFTRLPAEVKRQILGENFRRILRRVRLPTVRVPRIVSGAADVM